MMDCYRREDYTFMMEIYAREDHDWNSFYEHMCQEYVSDLFS